MKKDIVTKRYLYTKFRGQVSISYKGKQVVREFEFVMKNFYKDITYVAYISADGDMVVADKDAYIKNKFVRIMTEQN